MIVRTIDLLNHLRCRRFGALHAKSLSHSKDEDLFLGLNEDIEDLLSDEESSEYLSTYSESISVLRSLFFKHYQDLLPEAIANVQYSAPFNDDFTLESKIDFVNESIDETTFVKINPSSASHFLKIKYSFEKHKYPLFEKDSDGIYQPRLQRVVEGDRTNYYDKLKRCLSRHFDTGRLVYDLGFSEFVIGPSHPTENRRYLCAMLNADYIRTDESEIGKELFVIFDFTDLVISLQSKIQADLYRMANLIELNDDSRCLLVRDECLLKHPFECEYTDFCFSHIPKVNSVLDYFSSHLGFKEGPHKSDPVHETYDLINEGIVDMLDVPISWLQRQKNLMQRYCVENDYTFINVKKMKDYLKRLSYPLYFLDFESYPSPIPRFPGESPYSQSVFQYSLHIKMDSSSKNLIHKEYLMTDHQDHRRELVEDLLESIPIGKSPIVVYNMTFEQSRLQEFQTFFPEYLHHLKNIEGRLFDLLKLLKTDLHFFLALGYPEEEAKAYNFYHPLQSGSYSIKRVLKALGEDRYEKLEVQNGVMAYSQYLRIPTLDQPMKEKAMESLKAYCKQDTLSMVTILNEISKRL
ncbi:MAG: DUF2779 domain-containing protein [Firmicutes bacterium]|nr:DUF2779 domain-containing protein [Bacillota bacterium]